MSAADYPSHKEGWQGQPKHFDTSGGGKFRGDLSDRHSVTSHE